MVVTSRGGSGHGDEEVDGVADELVVGPGRGDRRQLVAVEHLREPERLVDRELALDLAGGHVRELAEDVVDHREVERVLVDPEHPEGNYGYLYPIMRNFNFGLNLSF